MKFSSFNLKQELINSLEKQGYLEPTDVQTNVIPKLLKGENIVVQSETGTGKTHSFLIPILNNLEYNNKIQAIIISPTIELATQIYNFINKFKVDFNKLSAKLFVSGKDSDTDINSIKNGCQIVICTPGRLNFIKKYIKDPIRTMVLDEADMLLDDGFLDIIDEIITKLSPKQIEVFSATINKKVQYFAKKYINADYVIEMNKEHSTSKTVKHFIVNVKHSDLFESVVKFIKFYNPYFLLIFSNTKKEASDLYDYLSRKKYKCGIISGDLTPRERKQMLRRIKSNEFQIVCCSDLASRGLDIDDVSDVLSLSLPNNIEYYFHRAGRTGRNFKSGNSYIFYNKDQTKEVDFLKENKIDFTYLKISNDEFIKDKNFIITFNKNKKAPTELDKEIKKVVNKNKNKKIKPGYKKKIKREVDKLKSKHRREIIKKDIRRQMTERYKKYGK